MKAKKRYSPVRVRHPMTDGHSIRLQPRQGIELVLSLTEGQNWQLRLASDFLVIENVDRREKTGQIVYKISQKWDLQEWSRISNVFLGNIWLNDGEHGPCVRLCVQLDCSDKNKNNVLTIINPNNHLVKMEPNQVVQMVIWDHRADLHSKHDFWKPHFKLGTFELLRSETVIANAKEAYDRNDLFCSEPRSSALSVNTNLEECFSLVYGETQGYNINRKVTEHHFWFRLTRDEQVAYNNKPNGTYFVDKISLDAKPGYVAQDRNIEIMVSLRGSNRKGYDNGHYEMVTQFAKNWMARKIDLKRNVIFHPNSTENIELTNDQNSLYLEVAQPSEYFDNCDDRTFWRIEASKYATQIEITEFETRMVNGKYVQRFKIDKIMEPNSLVKPAHAHEVSYIAAIKFQIEKLVATDFNDPRMLTINLWRSKNNVASAASPILTKPITTNYGCSNTYQNNTCRSLTVVNKEYAKRDDPKDLYYTDIEIEELDCSSFGGMISKLKDIKPILDDEYSLYYGYAGYYNSAYHSAADWKDEKAEHVRHSSSVQSQSRKKKLSELWINEDAEIHGAY